MCNLSSSKPLRELQHREWCHAHIRKGTFLTPMERMQHLREDKSLGACILLLHCDFLLVSLWKARAHYNLLGLSPSPFLTVWSRKDGATPDRKSGSLRFWPWLNVALFMSFGGRNRVVESWRETQTKKSHAFYAYKGKSESHEDWVPLVYSWFCHCLEKRSLRKVSVMWAFYAKQDPISNSFTQKRVSLSKATSVISFWLLLQWF